MVLINSLIYLLANLFTRAVPFLLLPALTRYLTPQEYGAVAMLQVFLSVLISLHGGIRSNIARSYFSLASKKLSKYITAVYVSLVFLLVAITTINLVYLCLDFPLFGLEPRWFLAMPIVSSMSVANLLYLTVIRFQERTVAYATWEFFNATFNLGLSLLLVVSLAFGWEGRALGIVTPMVILGALGVVSLLRQGLLVSEFEWRDVREVLAVSISLIPHVLSSVIISLIDRLFISALIGMGAVGVYTLGYQFASVILLGTTSVLMAWQPWFYRTLNAGTGSGQRKIVKATYLYTCSLVAFCLIYTILAQKLLPLIVDQRYWSATEVVPVLVLGCFFYGIYQIFFPYLVHMKKTGILAIATPLGAALNVFLNYIWIPAYGMKGAAWATAAAYFLIALIVAIASIRWVALPWLSWPGEIRKPFKNDEP